MRTLLGLNSSSALARRLLALLSLTLAGCVVPASIGALSQGVTGGSSSGATDTITTDGSSSGDTTGQALCDTPGLEASAIIAWELEVPFVDEEVIDRTRGAPCVVAAIDGAGPIVVTMECLDPDLGPSTDTLTISLSAAPELELDLELGAAVTLEERSLRAFEVHNGFATRLLDQEGEVIVAALALSTIQSPGPVYDEEYLNEVVSPLVAEIVPNVCSPGTGTGAITLKQGDPAITRTMGDHGVLVGDGGSWHLSVETALWSDSGDIDVTVVRTKNPGA